MRALFLDDAIANMCHEIKDIKVPVFEWETLSEERLMQELTACLFSSQLKFEIAEAMAKKVYEDGYLKREKLLHFEYEESLLKFISEPVQVTLNGKNTFGRIRFAKKWSNYLSHTAKSIYEDNLSLTDILTSAHNSDHARESLIKHVKGFGPKQASLYLRRVGFCSKLAVLDVHILDYLEHSKGLKISQSSISRLPTYKKIEEVFQSIALQFGHSVGCVDFATWVTMRVAKREGYI